MRDAIAMASPGPATQCIERVGETTGRTDASGPVLCVSTAEWRMHHASKSRPVSEQASPSHLVNTATQVSHELYVLADDAHQWRQRLAWGWDVLRWQAKRAKERRVSAAILIYATVASNSPPCLRQSVDADR